ncbi:toprim domain-containing protein [Acidovorax sp. LjRoot118]|uniref:DUF7146 domain-containing protein n=1 Tax=Acidovorax sp. LjRoot118 TaxID=3342256 RepID=UPI003ECC3EAF
MLATDRVKGRWRDLFIASGVDEAVLNGKHHPCPICGGTDRFRFPDKGTRLWVCTSCTDSKYSSGLQFLHLFLRHSSLKQTAAWIHDYYDGNPVAEAAMAVNRAETPAEIAARNERRLWVMNKVLSQTVDVKSGDPVDLYLRSRVKGLQAIPSGIRIHPGLEYWERPTEGSGKPTLVGVFPAMVLAGRDENDRLVQIHKTYLTPEGAKAPVSNPKKTDVGVGCNSYAFRLQDVEGDTLGVGEGAENSLRGGLLFNVPAWPCHCASVLANFTIPARLKSRIRKLYVFTDNDPKVRPDGSPWNPGAEAGATLAARMRAEKIKVMVIRPAKGDTDMTDLA